MGGLGDSFYEYLLKSWIQSGKTDVEGREMFDEAMKAVLKHMLQTSPGGLLYISDLKYDKLEQKMDALACFAGEVSVFDNISSICHVLRGSLRAPIEPGQNFYLKYFGDRALIFH